MNPSVPLKIDVVVHGRFWAFDLARALLAKGHDVVVHTNYPKWVCARWDLPAERVRSFLLHGAMSRTIQSGARALGTPQLEPFLHKSFGAWAARNVRRDADLIHCFSGVAEETLRLARSVLPGKRQIVRGSAHIREQHRLLAEEEQRLGRPIDKPSRWMIEREEREYALADEIVVLSSFAEESFVRHGIARERLIRLPLGVEAARFLATPSVIRQRCARVESGAPLTILTVGTLSARKGGLDLVAVSNALKHLMRFRFVGDLAPEMMQALTDAIERVPRVPQFDLPTIYADADLFLFPTIEDGFAVVLAQAAAAGLPILTTSNCSGPDLVVEGKSGWILPIRNPSALIERLTWCHENRTALSGMLEEAYRAFRPRDWTAVADDLVRGFSKPTHSEARLAS